MNNHAFWEKVILRGLEGMIGDQFLQHLIKQYNTDSFYNYVESKYMAQQVFAQMRGWGID